MVKVSFPHIDLINILKANVNYGKTVFGNDTIYNKCDDIIHTKNNILSDTDEEKSGSNCFNIRFAAWLTTCIYQKLAVQALVFICTSHLLRQFTIFIISLVQMIIFNDHLEY